MRTKTLGINVRVTESEKKKLKRNAKLCGLSLSGYLRKVGLGKEINPIPDKDYYKLYRIVSELREKLPGLNETGVDLWLENLQNEFFKIYSYKAAGDEDGGNKNMGG